MYLLDVILLNYSQETPLEADETHLEDERQGGILSTNINQRKRSAHSIRRGRNSENSKIIEQAIEELFNTIVTLSEHFKEDSGVADRFKFCGTIQYIQDG